MQEHFKEGDAKEKQPFKGKTPKKDEGNLPKSKSSTRVLRSNKCRSCEKEFKDVWAAAQHFNSKHNGDYDLSRKPMAGGSGQPAPAKGEVKEGKPPQNKGGKSSPPSKKPLYSDKVKEGGAVPRGGNLSPRIGSTDPAPANAGAKGKQAGGTPSVGRTVIINGKEISVKFIQDKLTNLKEVPNIYLAGYSFGRSYLARLLSNKNIKTISSKYLAPARGGGQGAGGRNMPNK